MSRLKLTDKDICGMYSRGLNLPELCGYKYCFNRGVGKIIVIYPSEFREWIEKNSHDGKTVSNRHSWRVIRNLCDRGFGEIIRSGFGRIELILYSLDFVFGRNGEDKTKPPKPDPETSEPSIAAAKSPSLQQQLILTKQMCQSAGINYRLEKDWWEIVGHGIEKIEATIEVLKYRLNKSNRNPIYNPCGWFKQALRDNYYLDFDFDYSPPNLVQGIMALIPGLKEKVDSDLRKYEPKKN